MAITQAGRLLDFLQVAQGPLCKYPYVAKSHFGKVCTILRTRAFKDGIPGQPHPAVQLVSNFLLVPSLRLEKMMSAVIDEMLILRPPLGTAVHAKGLQRDPEYFYLRRRFDLASPCLEYNVAKQQLRIKPEDDDGVLVLRTSQLYEVTLDKNTMIFLTIPLRALHFCYVHEGPEFSPGGFLYLDSDYEPLALNQLSMGPAESVMFFQHYVQVRDTSVKDLVFHPVPWTSLQSQGYKEYAFVGPSRMLDHVPTGLGGFAYKVFRRGEHSIRFFGISAAGQLLQRGQLTRNARTNTALLHEDAEPATIKSALTKSSKGTDSCEVNIARTKVDLLHPLILHALSRTPRAEVLRTEAVSAIVSEAVRQSRIESNLEFPMNAMSLACVSYLTKSLRLVESAAPREETVWQRKLCFLVILFNWVKVVVMELFFLIGHCRYGWLTDFVQEVHSIFSLFILSINTYFIAYLFVNDYDLPSSDSSRLLCGIVGCLMWFRLLWTLRTVERLNVGRRILPILGSLTQASSFLLVSLFFFGASMQVSLAFTEKELGAIFFDTYRMGVIGDMKASLFIDRENVEGVFTMLPMASHVAYMLFGFLVMVSMANIFIQVMGQAYDAESKHVEVSFNRARAFRGLQFALYNEMLSKLFDCCNWKEANHVIWYCYRREDEDEPM
eukprot:TRINITY_DN21223_c0_g2_i1.p1 TRINITY_DN21223_c0_g2~~TRINITY_DN21223_c0_g2_i1.p1  ORF type:complete len:739 (-),score=70.92 TRINITY_DN21223_c0_g2_i1:341-2338(-)